MNLPVVASLIGNQGNVVQYNSYLTTYLLRLTASGYTWPSVNTLTALNVFFNSVGALLPRADAGYMLALADAALSNAARVNIVNPGANQGDYVLSPTYGTAGILTDGVASYFDTNFNPSTQGVNYTLNAASRIAYVYTAGLATTIDGLASGSAGRNMMGAVASASAHRINSGTNNLNVSADLSGAGYKAITRLDSTNVSLYNGITKLDRTATSTALENANQAIGRNGSIYGNNLVSFHLMGGIYTQAEHALIRSSLLTYLSAIGL